MSTKLESAATGTNNEVKKEFFTLKEAAKIIGRHEATLRIWINSGSCPAITIPAGKNTARRIHIDTILKIKSNLLKGLPPTYNLNNLSL